MWVVLTFLAIMNNTAVNIYNIKTLYGHRFPFLFNPSVVIVYIYLYSHVYSHFTARLASSFWGKYNHICSFFWETISCLILYLATYHKIYHFKYNECILVNLQNCTAFSRYPSFRLRSSVVYLHSSIPAPTQSRHNRQSASFLHIMCLHICDSNPSLKSV